MYLSRCFNIETIKISYIFFNIKINLILKQLIFNFITFLESAIQKNNYAKFPYVARYHGKGVKLS